MRIYTFRVYVYSVRLRGHEMEERICTANYEYIDDGVGERQCLRALIERNSIIPHFTASVPICTFSSILFFKICLSHEKE
jgi:hypothetical protein